MDNKYQEKIKKGYITLNDMVVVSDPYYPLGVWCQTIIENVLPGRYKCFLDTIDMKNLGVRNARISIYHEDYDIEKYYPTINEHDSVYVDSGQAGFFNYRYYKENRGASKIERDELSYAFYSKCSDITLYNEDSSGTFDDKCFISSSGLGDGRYYLYSCKNSSGKIVALALEFIDDTETDENEDN